MWSNIIYAYILNRFYFIIFGTQYFIILEKKFSRLKENVYGLNEAKKKNFIPIDKHFIWIILLLFFIIQ